MKMTGFPAVTSPRTTVLPDSRRRKALICYRRCTGLFLSQSEMLRYRTHSVLSAFLEASCKKFFLVGHIVRKETHCVQSNIFHWLRIALGLRSLGK